MKRKGGYKMDQFTVPCIIYRGGTSRGLFFHKQDLPEDPSIRNKIFLKGIGSEDASQIDGLGAATSHTSKVVIIEKSPDSSSDILYTFIQLGIDNDTIDYEGTCGNLMAAVGAFAVDENLVDVADGAERIVVKAWSTNVEKLIEIDVPLIEGKAKVMGDYSISGIKSPGAKYVVSILNPGGGKTGSTLPVGARKTSDEMEFSFVDIVNPFVYVKANDLSLTGTELNAEITNHPEILQRLETIREIGTVSAGLADTVQDARDLYPAIPKVAYVAAPQDYKTSGGKLIRKEEIDILARMVSMKKMHRTFAVSGLLNIAASCVLKDTIPYELSTVDKDIQDQVIRVGHPEGVAEIRVGKDPDSEDILYVGLDRTARRIMDGNLYIPN